MIYKTDEKLSIENLHGGKGIISIEKCEINNHDTFKSIVKVKVPVNGSIGVHQHVDDYEGYYIMNGNGIFQDNHNSAEVSDGDFCLIQKGEFHGVENTGSENLIIFAVVLK